MTLAVRKLFSMQSRFKTPTEIGTTPYQRRRFDSLRFFALATSFQPRLNSDIAVSGWQIFVGLCALVIPVNAISAALGHDAVHFRIWHDGLLCGRLIAGAD